MKNISIQIDDNTFKKFSVACALAGTQKKSILIKLIKQFIEDIEDSQLLRLAKKRLKDFESGKSKTVSHKDAWK